MRILLVVYETIPTWPGSMLSPKIPPNNQGPFFHCSYTSWWFQPLWRICVKIGNLPQMGVKIKKNETTSQYRFVINSMPSLPSLSNVARSRNCLWRWGSSRDKKRWPRSWGTKQKSSREDENWIEIWSRKDVTYIIVRNCISWQDVDQDIWDL